jgi:hypothetical protein
MKNFNICIAIAAALNGIWEAKQKGSDRHTVDNDEWHRIVAPNGAAIHLYFPASGKDKNRISISGVWPHRKAHTQVVPSALYPQQEAPSITVSADKTPEQIAGDIEKRFLPVYLPMWEACYQRGQELNAAEDKELSAKEEITAVLDCKLSDREREPGNRIGRYSSLPGSMYIQDIYVGTGTVSLDIRSIPHDLAIKVLKLLKEGK